MKFASGFEILSTCKMYIVLQVHVWHFNFIPIQMWHISPWSMKYLYIAVQFQPNALPLADGFGLETVSIIWSRLHKIWTSISQMLFECVHGEAIWQDFPGRDCRVWSFDSSMELLIAWQPFYWSNEILKWKLLLNHTICIANTLQGMSLYGASHILHSKNIARGCHNLVHHGIVEPELAGTCDLFLLPVVFLSLSQIVTECFKASCPLFGPIRTSSIV